MVEDVDPSLVTKLCGNVLRVVYVSLIKNVFSSPNNSENHSIFYNKSFPGLNIVACWQIVVILALGSLRHEDC